MADTVEQHVDSPCPACHHQGLLMRTTRVDIPYFHDAMQTMLRCDACGFRHADFMVMGEDQPVRYVIPVTPDTLNARVVRGTSGTWRIPEFGFLAEPSDRSESFVTNVEGMMYRAKSVLLMARDFNADTDPAATARAEELMARVEAVLHGDEGVTLVIEDPTGNSLIAHADARREVIPPEEAERLQRGFLVFET